MTPISRVDQRVRALAVARDCAALGARIRTIHHLTGLRPQELLHLLFTDRSPPPRGRAPDTREWYHNANLLYRTEASVIVSNFRRLRLMGFEAAEALVAAYRYYQSVYRPPSRISFDRAFDLAAHAEGLWIAKSASFRVATCQRCGSEFLDALGSPDTAIRPCPFCQLLDRHGRDPRLTAAFSGTPPVSSDMAAAWMQGQDFPSIANGETSTTSFGFPAARS